ncbi:MAG: alanine:cation symporter family protein [Desulfurivibrio sp.]|nr:alanine:cation symporter family protein [Desulfurivibrio sp.]
MEQLTALLTFVDGLLGSAAYFPFLLLGTGLFFTLYLKFPQVRFFPHAWRVVLGKYDRPGDEGDASHFQALTTAMSGTVGTGNIGGASRWRFTWVVRPRCSGCGQRHFLV